MTLEVRIKKLIREEIGRLSAYHVPAAQNLIKLDAMENPYEWSDDIKQAWLALLSHSNVNRYPDASAQHVKTQLRRVMQVTDEYDIVLGNGSDEIIQMLAMAVAQPGRTILAPEPCFVMYRMIAAYTQMKYVGVPLKEQFDLDIDAMMNAIERHDPALIFIAQPNNPTGNLFNQEKIEKIVQVASGLVVIDEAYTAFTDADFLPWLARFENVVVMRTLSKIGLAGLRLGMLIGKPAWLAEIEKIRLPYNVNVLTQLSAEFSLMHYDLLMEQAQLLRRDREDLYQYLTTLKHIAVWPSQANFLLVKVLSGQAKTVHACLRDEFGILVKCLDGTHSLLENCLRLTVGTPTENDQLKKALQKLF